MTSSNPTALFKQYLPLAYKLAAKFAAAFPRIDAQDIQNEAVSTLALYTTKWDTNFNPARSGPLHYLYFNIYTELQTFCLRKQDRAKVFSAFSREGGKNDPQPVDWKARAEHWTERLFRNLGEDAKVVVQTILEAPEEIAQDLTRGARRGKQQEAALHRAGLAVMAYLEGTKGWAPHRVEAAWKEVGQAL